MTTEEFRTQAEKLGFSKWEIKGQIDLHEKFLREGLSPFLTKRCWRRARVLPAWSFSSGITLIVVGQHSPALNKAEARTIK